MKKTIFKQLILIYVLLSLFLLITVGVYFLQYLHKEQFRVSIEKTNLLWENLSYNIEDISISLNSPLLNQRLMTLSKNLKAMIFIYDNNDRVIARYYDGQLDDSEYVPSELEALIKNELKFAQLYTSGKHFNITKNFISAYPIYYRNSINGYFVIIQNRSHILDSWNEFLGEILQIIFLVFAIALVVFIIFSQKLVFPIKHLTKVASLINVKNMDIPIIKTDNNEIGELADQFRLMSQKLKDSFEEINTQKEMLMSVMNSIHQAIWVVDDKGLIKLYNNYFKSLVSIEEIENVYLFNILRNHNLIKIFQDTLTSKSYFTSEIEIEDKIFMCTSAYVKANKSIILTLLDITDIKSVEKLKKDFISNVSHELKTPLTAIKGFVETMLEDLNEDNELNTNKDFLDSQRHCLQIINRNTNRLIYIVTDLLSLSRLEQEQEIQKDFFTLKDMIERIQLIFTDKLSQNGKILETDLQENIPDICADEYRMEQVLINLIDNAIKYSNGEKIYLSVKHKDSIFEIKVKDEGEGIKPQHLKRIFERFYVVDSSRSKRMGGTGLGLSIVKHIINLHNGEISVESKENQGTCFKICIPE